MNLTVQRFVCLLAVLGVAGCATVPIGPSVMVLPGSTKTFEQFQLDDSVCQNWAGRQVGLSPQDTINQNVATGATAGTLIGAGLGAALGAAHGDPGIGAAIGAASGLLFGTAAGAGNAQTYGYDAQRRFDNAYQQCMYAKGHQIPGMESRSGMRRAIRPYGHYPVPPDYVPGSGQSQTMP